MVSAKSKDRFAAFSGVATGSSVSPLNRQRLEFERDGKSYAFDMQSAWRLGAQLGGSSEITEPFAQNPWLFAMARTKATAVQLPTLRIYASGDPEEADEIEPESDALVRMLTQRPNRYCTTREALGRSVFDRSDTGEHWWGLAGPDGMPVKFDAFGMIDVPAQIVPMSGRHVGDPRCSDRGMPIDWPVSFVGGAKLNWPHDAMLGFIDPDPTRLFRGLGVIDSAARWMSIDFQAQRYIEALCRNGGEPGGVITTKDATSAEEIRRLQTKADDIFMDSSKRGRMLVLAGAEFTPNGLSPKDMEFQALQEWVRELLSTLMGVPLAAMGVFKDANYAMLEAALKAMWTGANGVLAFLASIERVLNESFFPRLKDPVRSRWRAYFDTSNVAALNEDKTASIEAAVRTSNGARIPLNAALALHGVDAVVEGGDVYTDPFAGMDFGIAGEPDDEEDDEPIHVEPDEDVDEDAKAKSMPVVKDAHDLDTADKRAAYWRTIEKSVMQPGERIMRSAAATFDKRYAEAQLTRVRAFARGAKSASAMIGKARQLTAEEAELARRIEVLLLNKHEWEEKMRKLFDAPIKRVTSRALSAAAEEVGGASIGIGDPRIVEQMARQSVQLVEGVTSTLAQRVQTALTDVLSRATSIADLQAAVKEMMPEIEGAMSNVFANRDARAQTIARTESGHATESARFKQFESDGIQRIRWIAQADGATRESHARADGEVRRMGDRFSNGLRYPLDPNGPAGEVIQCRCSSAPVFED